MIYKALHTIPYKLFTEISATGDVKLLSDQLTDINVLNKIWEDLYNNHLSKNNSSENEKIFRISKMIDRQLALHKTVLMSCTALRFDFNQQLYDLIIGYGYKLSLNDSTSYYNDLKTIERQSGAYLVKAERYKEMLPKDKENSSKEEYTIDDVMASYCEILKIDFDCR